MNDEELRRGYRDALRGRPGDEVARGVSLEQIEALAAGRLPEPEAMALLDRVMADDRLRAEFELLRSVHEAAVQAPSRRWVAPVVLAATVVVAVGGAILTRPRGGDPPRVRSGGVVAVALLAPAEDASLPRPVVLTWRPVADAVRYGVEVLDEAGTVVFTGTTRDTLVALPDSVLAGGARYRWLVSATTPLVVVRAAPRSFSVTR
ncbi:MAG: hypothetical protein AB7S39_16105 [Gemmatimonadales bacterium]